MIARRDLLIGSACVAAAAAAYALKPRKYFSLLGNRKVDQIVPRTVGEWVSRDVGNLVAPPSENSLSATLYDETIERIYRHESTNVEVMVLMAHGDTESNTLQLHRPEVCYPFFGFEVSESYPTNLPLRGEIALPARRLVAAAPGRRETIVYWSRLGEFLPVDGTEQRLDRLRTAMSGYVADGLLARFSVLGPDPVRAAAILEAFIPAVVLGVAADKRQALIGTKLAQAVATSAV